MRKMPHTVSKAADGVPSSSSGGYGAFTDLDRAGQGDSSNNRLAGAAYYQDPSSAIKYTKYTDAANFEKRRDATPFPLLQQRQEGNGGYSGSSDSNDNNGGSAYQAQTPAQAPGDGVGSELSKRERRMLARVSDPQATLLYTPCQARLFYLLFIPIVVIFVLSIAAQVAPIGVLRFVVYGGDVGGAWNGHAIETYYLWTTTFPYGYWGPLVKKKMVVDGTGLQVVEEQGRYSAMVAGEVGLILSVLLSVLLVPIPILVCKAVSIMNLHTQMRKSAQASEPLLLGGSADNNNDDSRVEPSFLDSNFSSPEKMNMGGKGVSVDRTYDFHSVTQNDTTERREMHSLENGHQGEGRPPLPLRNGEPETMAAGNRRLFQLNAEEDGELNEVSFQPSTRQQTQRAHDQLLQRRDLTRSLGEYVVSKGEAAQLRRLRYVNVAFVTVLCVLLLSALVGLAGVSAYYNNMLKEKYVAYRGQETRVGPAVGIVIAIFIVVLLLFIGCVVLAARSLRACAVILNHAVVCGVDQPSQDGREEDANPQDGLAPTAAGTSPSSATQKLDGYGGNTGSQQRVEGYDYHPQQPREGSAFSNGGNDRHTTAAPFVVAPATAGRRVDGGFPDVEKPHAPLQQQQQTSSLGKNTADTYGFASPPAAAATDANPSRPFDEVQKPVANNDREAERQAETTGGAHRVPAVYGYPMALPGPPLSELEPEAPRKEAHSSNNAFTASRPSQSYDDNNGDGYDKNLQKETVTRDEGAARTGSPVHRSGPVAASTTAGTGGDGGSSGRAREGTFASSSSVMAAATAASTTNNDMHPDSNRHAASAPHEDDLLSHSTTSTPAQREPDTVHVVAGDVSPSAAVYGRGAYTRSTAPPAANGGEDGATAAHRPNADRVYEDDYR